MVKVITCEKFQISTKRKLFWQNLNNTQFNLLARFKVCRQQQKSTKRVSPHEWCRCSLLFISRSEQSHEIKSRSCVLSTHKSSTCFPSRILLLHSTDIKLTSLSHSDLSHISSTLECLHDSSQSHLYILLNNLIDYDRSWSHLKVMYGILRDEL